ncbi:hypothetical protein OPV22_025449 [Ensete ventricosum]|uniref:Uncharacterized protein n=1 Tax=Ensete ventricosum TaxID=4639 RepID=A0AAV8P7H8_ENSVE|nr:hypothetical protein OPV22_025449 [Ensete ventricosum]
MLDSDDLVTDSEWPGSTVKEHDGLYVSICVDGLPHYFLGYLLLKGLNRSTGCCKVTLSHSKSMEKQNIFQKVLHQRVGHRWLSLVHSDTVVRELHQRSCIPLIFGVCSLDVATISSAINMRSRAEILPLCNVKVSSFLDFESQNFESAGKKPEMIDFDKRSKRKSFSQ